MFDYRSERYKIETDVFLCYDNAARGDLAVRFIRLKDGQTMVLLFLEPDRPFEGGSVREVIRPHQFATRIINGTSLVKLIRANVEGPID